MPKRYTVLYSEEYDEYFVKIAKNTYMELEDFRSDGGFSYSVTELGDVEDHGCYSLSEIYAM